MTFENQGTEIAFDDIGSGNAVLFVHGHPFNRTMWLSQVQSLRGKYRVVVPDLRGYGQSSCSSDQVCTQQTFADDMSRLLDYLCIERACIVGLSMGGQIAMEFARAFPDRTAGVVLAATFPQAETPEGMVQRNKMADRLISEGMAIAGSEMLPRLIGARSLKEKPSTGCAVYQMICTTNPVGAAAALRGRALRSDYTETLMRIQVPCLIVVGTEDAYSTVNEAERMHAAIPDCRLEVFSGIGHMPNLEDEDRFNHHLHDLLAAIAW